MTDRAFRAAVAAAFVLVALAAFAPILTTGFVADDWEFLWIVRRATSVLVSFEPLVGRFVRPWVVLTYYVNHKAFGLWPFPYHLTVLLMHVLSAWLVCCLTERVAATRPRLTGVAAGLLFLLFSGHTEAVSWVAGVADPALLPFLLGGLLAMARALEAARPAKWIAVGWMLFAGALLAKETSVIFPLLALAFGALATAQAADRPRAIRRTLVFAGGPAVLVAAYVLMRSAVFGTPFGAYGGLGTSGGMFLAQTRAFLVRTFFPPVPQRALAAFPHIDVFIVSVAAVALAVVLVARARDRWPLLFALSSVAIALAPALPLTISLISSESERYVYVASAFSSMAIAIACVTMRRPSIGISALALLLVAHVYFLERSHRAWNEAADVFDRFVQSFAATLHQRRDAADAIALILNLPDNVRGAYVFRNGFASAIRIRFPELTGWADRTRIVASHGLSTSRDRVAVTITGRHEYAVDISPNRFLQVQAPATVHYTFPRWEATRYDVQLASNVWSAVVFGATDGRAVVIDEFAGEGAPFGVVDIPSDGVVCEGERIRFSGWALDNVEVVAIDIARERFANEPGDSLVSIASGTWATGTRPDIAAAYKTLPHVDRAEWNYYLPCAQVAAAPGRSVRVHVVASDADGHRADLGARTVRGRP
jgi:hypothetical protein